MFVTGSGRGETRGGTGTGKWIGVEKLVPDVFQNLCVLFKYGGNVGIALQEFDGSLEERRQIIAIEQ